MFTVSAFNLQSAVLAITLGESAVLGNVGVFEF